MLFRPDVEALLRRPTVEKPHEEFVLPSPETFREPLPEARSPEALEPAPDLLTELLEEAAILDDLYAMIVATAEPITLSLSEEEQLVLGETLSTQDFINAIGQEDYRSERVKRRFEEALVNGCDGPDSGWTLLPLIDLHDMRQGLLNVASSVEGTLLSSTRLLPVSGQPGWSEDVAESHLHAISRAQIDASRDYRVRLGETIFTMRADLRSEVLERVLTPLAQSSLKRLKPVLSSILEFLELAKSAMCVAMLVRSLEFLQVRQALLGLIKRQVVATLLNSLISMLHQVKKEMLLPLLDRLIDGIEGVPLVADLADTKSLAFVSTIGESLRYLDRQYTDIAVDILREIDQENQGRLKKLQSLGERNVFGRWIQHLNQAIQVIQQALTATHFAEGVSAQLSEAIFRTPSPTPSRTREAFEARPEYLGNRPDDFQLRNTPLLPVDGIETRPAIYNPDAFHDRTGTSDPYGAHQFT